MGKLAGTSVVGKNHLKQIPKGVKLSDIEFEQSNYVSKYSVTDEEKLMAVTSFSANEFIDRYRKLHEDSVDLQRMTSIWASRSFYISKIKVPNSNHPLLRGVRIEHATTKSMPDVETLLTHVIDQNAIIISIMNDSLKVQKDTLELFRSKMSVTTTSQK